MLGHNSGNPFTKKDAPQSNITDHSVVKHAVLVHLDEAFESLLLCHPQKSLDCLRAAEILNQDTPFDKDIVTRIALEKTACFLKLGDSDAAQKILDDVLRMGRHLVFADNNIRTYHMALSAVCAHEKGEIAKAEEIYINSCNESKNNFPSLSLFPELKGVIALTHAQYLEKTKNPKMTETYLKAIVELSDSKHHTIASAHIFAELARANFKSGDYTEAVKNFEKAALFQVEERYHSSSLEFEIDFGMACAIAEAESIYGGMQLLENAIYKLSTIYELSKRQLSTVMSYILSWDLLEGDGVDLLKLAKTVQNASRRLHGEDVLLAGKEYLKLGRWLADDDKFMEAQDCFARAEEVFKIIAPEDICDLMSAQKGRFQVSTILGDSFAAYKAASAFSVSTKSLPAREYKLKADSFNCLALAALMTSRHKLAVACCENASIILQGDRSSSLQNLMSLKIKAAVADDLGCFHTSAKLYKTAQKESLLIDEEDFPFITISLAWSELYGDDYDSCSRTLSAIPKDSEDLVLSQVGVIKGYLALKEGKAIPEILEMIRPSIDTFTKFYNVKTVERAKIDRWYGDLYSCTDDINKTISYYRRAEETLSQLNNISFERLHVNYRLMNLYKTQSDVRRAGIHYHIATRIENRLRKTAEFLGFS